MVKIFIGNLSAGAKEDELRALFEEHGKVNECDIISTYGFVVSDHSGYLMFSSLV